MPAEQRKLDVVEREQAIFRYLRETDRAVGATVRELHEHLTVTGVTLNGREVRDTVTVQAYHKLVTRLVLDGRLVEVDDPDADAQRYALAPALHADTALTLDDIDQIAFELKPTEAIAALIDAREMVGANRKTVLRQAALALQKVPPRDLVRDMILAKVEVYNARVAEWREYGRDDERHRRLVEAARKELEKICYRWFGLSADAIRVPPASSVSNSGTGAAPIEKIRPGRAGPGAGPARVRGHRDPARRGRQPVRARRLVERRGGRQRRQHLLQRDEHRHRQGVRRRGRQRGRHLQQLHRLPAHGGPEPGTPLQPGLQRADHPQRDRQPHQRRHGDGAVHVPGPVRGRIRAHGQVRHRRRPVARRRAGIHRRRPRPRRGWPAPPRPPASTCGTAP